MTKRVRRSRASTSESGIIDRPAHRGRRRGRATSSPGLKGPVVLLATAHPAKFPEAVTQAIGIAPEIPPKLAGLMAQEERYTVLPNEVGAVRTFVLERTGTS